jgi:uncharacterized protein YhaN
VKFLSMHMPAFGPFTDFQLEFGSPGLQVVYGPNESGKSSSLRAFRALLYGIHSRTPDDFLHAYGKLAIGAKLQHSDGTVLELVRRKKRKDSLKTLDGETVDQARLGRFTGNLTEEVFDRLYGLDHSTLSSGGKALLDEGGKVGESLFAANVGPAFRQVRESLHKDAEELWLPRGSTPALNVAINDWKTAQGDIKETSLQVSKYDDLQQEMEQQKQAAEHNQEELNTLNARLHTLKNHQAALPSWARYKEYTAQLEQSSELPDLSEDFSQRRERVRADYDQVLKDLERLQADRTKVEVRLEGLSEAWPILAIADGVEAIFPHATRAEDIESQIPSLEAELRQRERQVRASREDLGFSAESDQDSFPDTSVRAEARQLATEHRDASSTLQTVEESITAFERKLERSESKKHELTETGELAELELMLTRARAGSNWEERLHELRGEYKAAKTALDSELQSLPFWGESIESLKSLPVPSSDCVDQMDRELQKAESSVQQAEREAQQTRRSLDGLLEQLSRLEADGPVPSPERLQELRNDRDGSFDKLLSRWDGDESLGQSQDSVSAYRRSVEEADHQSDQIARDADRVATRSGLLRRKQELESDLERKVEAKLEREQTLEKLREEWEALWGDSLSSVRPPREMRRWLEQRKTVLARQREFDTVHQEGVKLDSQRQQMLDGLVQALQKAFPTLALPLDNLSHTLEFVEKKLSRAKEASGQRAALNQSIDDSKRELDVLLARRQHLKQSLDEWRPRWAQTLSHFSLAKEPTPEALNATLGDYEALQRLMLETDNVRRELEKLHAEKQIFESRLQALAAVFPDLKDQKPPTLARSLHTRLLQSREQKKDRADLAADLDELKKAREEARYQLQQAQKKVRALLSEASTSELDELPAIEREVRKRRHCTALRDDVGNTLRELGGGATLEEFCQTLGDLSAQELDAELEDLNQKKEALTVSQGAYQQRIGELREKIQQMDGSDRAAMAAENAAQHMTEGVDMIMQFMRLTVAEHVLKTEIENYRLKNEGPILKQSSHYFSTLTCGDYTELQSGFDENADEPVLHAVSKNGRLVGVNGMSDGTRDQLFLSLRLATIDQRAEHAESFPLIADDLLVQFDSERALATLRVLAEFGQRHQVLLFTHLDRDLRLAGELDSGLADVRSLERLAL